MPSQLVSLDTFRLVLPEILLVLAGSAIYVASAFTAARRAWAWPAALAIVVAGWMLYGSLDAAKVVHSGPLVVDRFAVVVRLLSLAVTLALVLLAARDAPAATAPELFGSLLLIAAGAMLLAVAGDLVFLFLALELISIPTYVVLYLGRRGAEAQEAAAKYFFFSVLSSAVLLYGLSLLYGACGSTRLATIQAVVASGTSGTALLARAALVLTLAGLAFRLAAVPFHFYAPDVYQGSSVSGVGLLAVVPKIAALTAIARLLVWTLPTLADDGWRLTLSVAVLTMTLGNVVALWQKNIRRLLAYSSIAHAGYMLIGVSVALAGGASRVSGGRDAAVLPLDGIGATLFYLVVYIAATLGAVAAVSYLSRSHRQIDDIDELAGAGRRHPLVAASLALFMFSLTGLPPMAGFWGKFALLSGALTVENPDLAPWFVGLAVVAVVNAAISAAYYLRVVAVMYFRPAEGAAHAGGGAGPGLVILAAAAVVLAAGVYPRPWIDGANQACTRARTSMQAASGASALPSGKLVHKGERGR